MSIVDCPHSTPTWVEMGKICLRTTNVKPRKLDLSIVNYVSEASYLERILRMRPIENDIVYSREGTSVFSACLIPKDVAVCLGQRLMLLRVYDSLSSSYIMHYLNSPEILKYANVEQQGIAAKHINVKQVKNYAIPLPPLAEQRRIVERIEELMELCDRIPKKVK